MVTPLWILLAEQITILSFFSPGEFITLLIFLGGMIGQFIWVKVRVAEISVEVAEIKAWRDQAILDSKEREARENKQNAILSRELSSAQIRIYDKISEVKDMVQNVLVKCAKHEGADEAMKNKQGS